MATLPSAAPAAPDGPRSWLGRVDDAIYYFERGVVVVALLALAIAYFFDIVSVEIAASDNAFDRVIYRLSGFAEGTRPDEAFRARVHGVITPIVLGVFGWVLSYLAVLGYAPSREWRFGRQLVVSALLLAGFVAVLFAIAYLPPRWVCGVTWLAFLGAYAWRAHVRGRLVPYVIAWVPGIAVFVWLLLHIEQSYAWAQDLGKVLIMWIGFMGASMATRDRKHIRIDFVRKAIGPTRRPFYNAASYAITIVFCGIMAVLAIAYFLHDLELDGKLTSIPIPLAWIVAPIALSLVVMIFRYIGRMVMALQGREPELGGEGELPTVAPTGSAGGPA